MSIILRTKPNRGVGDIAIVTPLPDYLLNIGRGVKTTNIISLMTLIVQTNPAFRENFLHFLKILPYKHHLKLSTNVFHS